MNKEFIPYEQALAFKELGFDEPCFGYYDNTGKLFFNTNGQPVGKDWVWEGNQIVPTDMVLALTFSQAFRWFREKYNYNHSIVFTKHPFGTDEYQYMILLEDDECVETNFKTYEEAELDCLNKLIEITKTK